VEKNFDLGKTDTGPAACDVVRAVQMQFLLLARNRNRIADMHENLDIIRVFDVSKNLRCRALTSCSSKLVAMSECGAIRAKQDGFWARVHRPLSGLGVFSVALG
jgi:hypothetical protein